MTVPWRGRCKTVKKREFRKGKMRNRTLFVPTVHGVLMSEWSNPAKV